MSTVFIDRDGVINENRTDYVKSWSEFRFLSGAREAITALSLAGHRIVICTNQAGIAKGTISVEVVEDMHARMLSELRAAGGLVEKVYYCPHSQEDNCDCRKPRPGLLLRASKELGLDMQDAVFVGDSMSDVHAGIAAGVHSMLVLTGLGMDSFRSSYAHAERPFRITINLQHAAELILNGTYIHTGEPTSLERACYALLDGHEPLESLLPLQKQFALLIEA